MGNVLVTGALGFIGHHLCHSLLADGHKVIGIDNLSTGSLANSQESANFLLYQQDLSQLNLLDLIGDEKIDVTYHLAATVGVRSVMSSPSGTIMNNILGTKSILNYCREKTVPLIFTSTSEVYGLSTKIPYSENDQRLLGAAHVPRWVYAESKALDEVLVLDLWRTYEIPSVVLRLFNTVGPRQSSQYGMVIPRFVKAAINGDDITIFGDGRQTRTFCDVRDVVKALQQSTQFEKTSGEVFNVGSNNRLSINDLAEKIRIQTLSQSKVIHIDPRELYGADFEETLHRVPDISKIKKILDWAPVIGLDKTLKDTISHHTTTK